jgi:hypothetical protein
MGGGQEDQQTDGKRLVGETIMRGGENKNGGSWLVVSGYQQHKGPAAVVRNRPLA